MAGIYLHIPFCKRRCIYCDFFSTTQSEQTDRYVEALCSELKQRKDYLEGEDIETVYWGGGTPSQLQKKHFERIFSTLYIYYNIRSDAEITIEANPDDLNEEYVKMLLTTRLYNFCIAAIRHNKPLKLSTDAEKPDLPISALT